MMTDEEAREYLARALEVDGHKTFGEIVRSTDEHVTLHTKYGIAAILAAAADVERRTIDRIVNQLRRRANELSPVYGAFIKQAADKIEADHRSLSEHSSRREE